MDYEAGRLSSALFNLPTATTGPLVEPARIVAPASVPEVSIERAEDLLVKKEEKKKQPTVPAQKTTVRDPEETRRTVIVKNLPLKQNAKTLRKLLQLSRENVESIRFRNLPVPQKFSNNKGLAKILKSYKSEDAAQTAYIVLKDVKDVDGVVGASRDLQIDGKSILVDRVCQEDKFSKFDKMRTVFIGRLSLKHDEDFLLREFSQIGKIQNVRIVRDPKTSESKKFGFVCFEQKAAVAQAVATYAKKLVDNRTLRVTKVMKEEEAKAVQERKALKGRHTASERRPHLQLNKLSKNKKRQIKADATKQGAARRVSKKDALKKKAKSKSSKK